MDSAQWHPSPHFRILQHYEEPTQNYGRKGDGSQNVDFGGFGFQVSRAPVSRLHFDAAVSLKSDLTMVRLYNPVIRMAMTFLACSTTWRKEIMEKKAKTLISN